ncbi:PTS sugar transporter subunit IIA [Nocardia cyriacigeorgica]|uniref:PTS sugar transporter subunit IIA n=1 Tax=Nocardia cyriacigeorgica TaxID=135487 RepID=UPI001894EE4C|nr:PTS glucose transporter subunit IIA [Nocardia cyriacigeorgica]MBF6454469.1 PTS glucose transporter subunit IIA [Nocardia cyriacigeorgica]MBF6480793.1 PTS glucose transporter subunit IIA [Nocardia cyriacigeorgica]MBF6552363.1 PTS glucose transporter subunit IIA [Nocardia cyriacigeorgica]
MTVRVLAPLPGRVLALADVPDPVFAGQLVGSGVAIDPARDRGALDVRAPIAGLIVKLHPHAFIVLGADGAGVLTHLGIDTVKLAGAGFALLAAEGDHVDAGTPIVRFDPTEIDGTGYSALCPIVVMDSARDSVDPGTLGTQVDTGATLFDWTPEPR